MTTREQLGCDEVQALAGAFALDAVTPDEASAIREHIETCADCRAEVARMVEVAALMPLALDETAPPAGLKQRILDAIAAETSASGIVSLPSAQPPGSGLERPGAEPPAAVAAAPRRSFWSSRAWPALAAAALVAAIGLGSFSYTLQQGQPRIYTLQVATAPQASGELIYVPKDKTAYVTFDGVPDPGSNRTYQMWLIHDGIAESIGTIKPDPNGKADATLKKDLGGYKQFSVTVEPEGGSAQPTGPQVLTQNL